MRVRIPTARATMIRFIRTSIHCVPPALRRHLGPRWAGAVTSERRRDDVSMTGAAWRPEGVVWGGWSRHSDLNRGPAVYETAALPLSYVGLGARLYRQFLGESAGAPCRRQQNAQRNRPSGLPTVQSPVDL